MAVLRFACTLLLATWNQAGTARAEDFYVAPNGDDDDAGTIDAPFASVERAIGFYANYHPGSIDFTNNTAFDNPSNYDMRVATGSSSSHTLRNNIAAAPGNAIVSLSGGTDDFNSWSLPVTVSDEDFVSLDTTQAYAAREADGSLPSMTLARLREDSDLIDRTGLTEFIFCQLSPRART